MGELGIGIDDLVGCSVCGSVQVQIFAVKKGWFVCCAKTHKCKNKTKVHAELLDAADEWGLKPSDTE